MKNLIHRLIEFELKNSPTDNLSLEELGVPDPREIVEALDKIVIGQTQAKKSLAFMMFNRAISILNQNYLITLDRPVPKSNLLMIGPTGTGKTTLIQALSEVCDIPILIYDITEATTTGYYGAELSMMLNRHINGIYEYVHSIISKLSLDGILPDIYSVDSVVDSYLTGIGGVIYIDEIDKLRMGTEHSRSSLHQMSIQNELLQYLEGANITLDTTTSDNKKVGDNKLRLNTLNTSNIFFIAGGAFVGLEETVSDRLYKGSSMGFTGTVEHKSKSIDRDFLMSRVTNDDLVSYGFKPELLGRMPLRAILTNLTVDSIKEIVLHSENSVYKQFESLFKLFNVKLVLEDEALTVIAKTALDMKIGARSLRNLFNKIFEDELYNIFDKKGTELIVTEKYVKEKLK